MILAAPYLILPPERPAIVRAHDLAGVPSFAEIQRRARAVREATFPFPIFVPAASGGGGNDANTRILVHCDGADGSTTFTNVGAGAPSSTVTTQGSAQVNTGVVLSGFGQSVLSDVSAGLQIADHTNNRIGTADFCFDFWLYNTSSSGFQIGKGRTGAGDFLVEKTSGGIIRVFLGGALILSASDALTLNTWQHHAVTRGGGTLKIWRGGVTKGSVADATNINTTANWNLLNADLFGIGIIGNADEFRLSIGTDRAGETWPPSAPY